MSIEFLSIPITANNNNNPDSHSGWPQKKIYQEKKEFKIFKGDIALNSEEFFRKNQIFKKKRGSTFFCFLGFLKSMNF